MSVCYWFTGLSGAGKTTIATALKNNFVGFGFEAVLLDGDELRTGINKGLGFSREDRAENVRRIAEVAKLFTEAGMITVVSSISPYEEDRQAAKAIFKPGTFLEIFVDTPIEVCEQRDVKGMYKKARAGEIQHFTGVDDPYEIPVKPDLIISGAEPLSSQFEKILNQCKILKAYSI